MRVKLKFPDTWQYEEQFTVRVYDLNYGNHVGNDSLLRFAHEVRLNYLKSIGQSEIDFFSHSLIMADAAIQFKGQMFHGDLISARLAVVNLGSFSFDLYYSFSNSEDKECCTMKTAMVAFDYNKQKKTKVDENFKTCAEKSL